jgi:hypothetical protein
MVKADAVAALGAAEPYPVQPIVWSLVALVETN